MQVNVDSTVTKAYLDTIGDDEGLMKRSIAVLLLQKAHMCGGEKKRSGRVASWLLYDDKMKTRHQNNIKATANQRDGRPIGKLGSFKVELDAGASLKALLETLEPVCTPTHHLPSAYGSVPRALV